MDGALHSNPVEGEIGVPAVAGPLILTVRSADVKPQGPDSATDGTQIEYDVIVDVDVSNTTDSPQAVSVPQVTYSPPGEPEFAASLPGSGGRYLATASESSDWTYSRDGTIEPGGTSRGQIVYTTDSSVDPDLQVAETVRGDLYLTFMNDPTATTARDRLGVPNVTEVIVPLQIAIDTSNP